ncbi:MAG: hypothetical protein JWL64_2240, partial [Frankiales bacterium]|nr:hypothetical protein [Frankiales bacterium]
LSALHHTVGGESLRVRVAQATPEGATLTLKALGAQIPAAELGRMVARFAAATTEAGQPVAPTGLQMIDGAISARCGRTSGHSSAHGLSFESAWLLSTSGEVALTLRR